MMKIFFQKLFHLNLFIVKENIILTKKRILITTALKETLNFNKPVIFLGEWCKLYENKKNGKIKIIKLQNIFGMIEQNFQRIMN